jgi:hypothetical protein
MKAGQFANKFRKLQIPKFVDNKGPNFFKKTLRPPSYGVKFADLRTDTFKKNADLL